MTLGLQLAKHEYYNIVNCLTRFWEKRHLKQRAISWCCCVSRRDRKPVKYESNQSISSLQNVDFKTYTLPPKNWVEPSLTPPSPTPSIQKVMLASTLMQLLLLQEDGIPKSMLKRKPENYSWNNLIRFCWIAGSLIRPQNLHCLLFNI